VEAGSKGAAKGKELAKRNHNSNGPGAKLNASSIRSSFAVDIGKSFTVDFMVQTTQGLVHRHTHHQ